MVRSVPENLELNKNVWHLCLVILNTAKNEEIDNESIVVQSSDTLDINIVNMIK